MARYSKILFQVSFTEVILAKAGLFDVSDMALYEKCANYKCNYVHGYVKGDYLKKKSFDWSLGTKIPKTVRFPNPKMRTMS